MSIIPHVSHSSKHSHAMLIFFVPAEVHTHGAQAQSARLLTSRPAACHRLQPSGTGTLVTGLLCHQWLDSTWITTSDRMGSATGGRSLDTVSAYRVCFHWPGARLSYTDHDVLKDHAWHKASFPEHVHIARLSGVLLMCMSET